MKHVLIFIFFSLSFALFGQNDTHPNFTQSQLDSALNGTKQVEIPSHFNSNGDKNTWDIDLKDLGDVINGKSNPSQIIALQDTTGCTSWTSASTNFQTDMPTADSLLFITINGTNYPINLPMDDGSTGSIPPAIAALMQTAIGNAITSAGYSATTSIGASGIFTNITYQLIVGNSPLTIQYTIKTGGFYNNLVIAKSVPYNCTYTNRTIKPTDTQLAVNTCPAITLAYSEGDLDTLRVYDCNTNDWRIVGAEHDYNYSLSPLIVGSDTTGIILTQNGVPKDTVQLPSPTIDTDIKLLFSVVNDSIRIDSFDNKLGTIVGSPQFIDDAINKPDLVQSAANDLRVSGTTILEGTDDPNDAKGSQLIYNTTSVMDGFYRQYLGTEGVVFNIDAIRNSSNRIVTIDYGDLLVNNIRVGRGIGNVATNTAVGTQVLEYNSTGFYNTGVGFLALNNNTTGAFNTAIGVLSQYGNIDGLLNTSTGYNSMSNGNDNYSSAFGAHTLTNSFGVYNNAFGMNALKANTSGYQNSGFGNGTLNLNTTGYKNTAIGHFALNSNIDGYDNLGIGYESLVSNISGFSNVAIGISSLENQTTSYSNTAIGGLSGNSILGNENTIIGFAAGKNSVGSRNVFIGLDAGQNETGNDKLYICNSTTTTPLLGGDFSTQELKIGGVQQFSIQYNPSGAGVANGSMFYGTDGALYFKGGSGTVTLLAAP